MSKLHPRNKHQGRYDLDTLSQTSSNLASYIHTNQYGVRTIDFFNPDAVRHLNQALLLHYYGLTNWEIPENVLCPAVPGRADYIHTMADLLYEQRPKLLKQKTPKVHCLDIGVGASCIYPIIGRSEYGWSFTGSDISQDSLKSASKIIDSNDLLRDQVRLIYQPDPSATLQGIVGEKRFDLVISNPPFHKSKKEAIAATQRKHVNLNSKTTVSAYQGVETELWTKGGELQFIGTLITESKSYASQIQWFSTLVSKKEHLPILQRQIHNAEADDCRIFELAQGQKQSRILTWTYLTQKQRKIWATTQW